MRGELRQAARDIADEDREAAGEGTNLRSAQIWRPLKAIARIAGGDWPEDIDNAEHELTQGAASAETADLMAELERQAQAWGVAADDEPGVIVRDDSGEDEF